ncbi:hypothetical protein COOONC_01310 [Cooperia oncophora]
MVTSEIVLNLGNEYETNILSVKCRTNGLLELREGSAGTCHLHVIPIGASGNCMRRCELCRSMQRRRFTKVRINSRCSVSCGPVLSTFEIGGILKFTHSLEELVSSRIEGLTNSFQGIEFPDVFHIANVFAQWFKTLLRQ